MIDTKKLLEEIEFYDEDLPEYRRKAIEDALKLIDMTADLIMVAMETGRNLGFTEAMHDYEEYTGTRWGSW